MIDNDRRKNPHIRTFICDFPYVCITRDIVLPNVTQGLTYCVHVINHNRYRSIKLSHNRHCNEMSNFADLSSVLSVDYEKLYESGRYTDISIHVGKESNTVNSGYSNTIGTTTFMLLYPNVTVSIQ